MRCSHSTSRVNCSTCATYELHTVRLRRIKHFLRILQVQRNRFFTDHRLFAGKRLQHNRFVQVVSARTRQTNQSVPADSPRSTHVIQRQVPTASACARSSLAPADKRNDLRMLRYVDNSCSGTFPFRPRRPMQFSRCVSFTVQSRAPSNRPRCPPPPDRPPPGCPPLPA